MRLAILLIAPALAFGQQRSELQQILDRLDRVEQENRSLAAEVRALRGELAAARAPTTVPAPESAPLDERAAVEERRTDELTQTKVESSQRLPVTLNGMVLFNAFLNGRANGGAQYPVTASAADNTNSAGASVAQSIVGFTFHGPRVL